jgi:hypothetical protein
MKRRLLTIAVFLLAGAVVNVAVAWGLTSLPPPSITPSSGVFASLDLKLGRLHYGYAHRTAFGREYVDLVITYGGPTPQRDLVFSDKELRAAAFPSWMRIGPTKQWSGLNAASAYGWPQLALWMASGGRESTATGGVHVFRFGTDHRFPATLVSRGFTLNTIFYAAILWLLICGPFVLRRLIRRRRGLCPKCAYPMGESATCTECGQTLPGHAVA